MYGYIRKFADVASAWEVDSPDEKYKLARQLFNAVTIENRTAVEVTPRPDLLPFFVSVSDLNTYRRKRRDSVSPLRQPDGYFTIAKAPVRRPVGRSRREPSHQPRSPKLSPEHVASLRRTAAGRSLRDLAAEFGVSHETIRAALRGVEPVGVA